MTHHTYKLRIYPNTQQQQTFKQWFGCCRKVYNTYLDKNINQYNTNKHFIFYNAMNKDLTIFKQNNNYLYDAPAHALQQELRFLERAIKDSYNPNLNKGFPHFKKRSETKNSCYLANQSFEIQQHHVLLTKIKQAIRFRDNKKFKINGKIVSGTLVQDGQRYFLCVTVEIPDYHTPKPIDINNTVGIDLGLKEVAVTSDGIVYPNNKYLRKAQKKLKRQQKKLAKCAKGSKNHKKAQHAVKLTHTNIHNKRNDYNHKLTHDMTTKYHSICVEDLNVSGMMANHCLAGAISDVSWFAIKTYFKYKSAKYGCNFVEINRFDATSQCCSNCGHKQKMPLKIRIYNCPKCGLIMDRDLNAAINIKNYGFIELMCTVGQGMPELSNLIFLSIYLNALKVQTKTIMEINDIKNIILVHNIFGKT